MAHPLLLAAANAHPSTFVLLIVGLVSGVAVGLTGMGGGALLTPALVLLLRVDPRVAIASDLVSSITNKPVGALVHGRRGTVSWALVVRLAAGSVPAAFAGAFVLHLLGNSAAVEADIKRILGWAMLVACLSLLAKALMNRSRRRREVAGDPLANVKTMPTILVGVVGGFIVGMTSVGSGSLMVVLLMLLYPGLSAKKFVGTDLVQAIPLVASAALGQAVFGHVNLTIAVAITVGAIPGTYLGARISSRAPDGIIRPILVGVLGASSLALLFDNHPTGLALALGIGLVVGLPLWAAADASLIPIENWAAAGIDRTRWVALLGIGAPFGVGLIAAVPYAFAIRRRALRPPVPAEPAPAGAS